MPRSLGLAIDNIEDFNHAIRGTRSQTLAVVVQLGIVLFAVNIKPSILSVFALDTHNHVLMGRFYWNWVRHCRRWLGYINDTAAGKEGRFSPWW